MPPACLKAKWSKLRVWQVMAGGAEGEYDRVVSENSCIPIRTCISLCSKASSTEIASENIARGPFHCDTTISRTESPHGDNS